MSWMCPACATWMAMFLLAIGRNVCCLLGEGLYSACRDMELAHCSTYIPKFYTSILKNPDPILIFFTPMSHRDKF